MEKEKAGKPAANSGAVWCPAVEGTASTPAANGDGGCLGAGAGVELEPQMVGQFCRGLKPQEGAAPAGKMPSTHLSLQ